ncbi:MAG: choloylglycine hydrolase family protein [Proteobacteria bacterium]|nr:choloylglycine hydrolase family protein [Pseudomonadota bacterium]MBU4275899.1 choloylglycine hydrolase family protein [Pseudomonadota bacterium]MBU4383934.1 choloylglycine hydrolase family protein [Pseudomonadota bacterium]MBU4606447.1 choloylglycine hydrolase family protein [Pseudomonadota bacterium]MCG2763575.1 choloylglycine hydrolase family protein [Desulfarculaceae bacterium]
MKLKPLALSLSLFAAMAMLPPATPACTDFIVKAADGTVVDGRSLEWAIPTKSKMTVHPRGQKFVSPAPGKKTGLTWTGKYGFVNVNMYGVKVTVDGMNEKGLSVGSLFLPASKFPQPKPQDASRSLFVLQFGQWILSNFSTVHEVKKALPSVIVWSEVIPAMGMEFTAHTAVHDAQGNSIVIEFMNHQCQVYDNPTGVMTNSPAFDWQLANLRNYLTLSPYNAQPADYSGLKVSPTGQGSGMLGLPGDATPPSRFIRAVMFTQFSLQPKDAGEAVNLADHILMTLDIPKGISREKSGKDTLYDRTMWVVIKDLKRRVYYFRSYGNPVLQAVHLDRLNLSPGAKQVFIPLENPGRILDVTDKLRN